MTEVENYAVVGEAEVGVDWLLPGLSVTLGARYDRENRGDRHQHRRDPGAAGAPAVSAAERSAGPTSSTTACRSVPTPPTRKAPYLDADNDSREKSDSRFLVNVQLTYVLDNMSVGFFARNLLDKDYTTLRAVQSDGARTVITGEPRTFGLYVGLEF